MKTILITGGNKGIGLALTKDFLALGYKVIAIARDFKDFCHADKVECIVYDLSNVEGIPALVESLGKIDILYSLPYDTYPQEKVNTMLKLNLEATIKLIEIS